MARKTIINIKVELRPDIQYQVIEEYSFWNGNTKRDWSFRVGELVTSTIYDSHNVCLGRYDEKESQTLLRFVSLLDIRICSILSLNELREFEKSSKLKQILRSMDGLYFRPDITQELALIYEFDNGQIGSSRKYSTIVEEQRYKINSTTLYSTTSWDKYKGINWEWRSNINGVHNIVKLTSSEFFFIKLCFLLSFLQNITWIPTSNYKDYFKLSYNEKCIDKAVSLGWIRS